MQVGMEIIPDDMPAEHSKLERMVQKMSLGQTNIDYDTMEVIVTGADLGVFKMMMLKPGTEDYYKSEDITAGGTAAQFQAAIKKYYTDLYGV